MFSLARLGVAAILALSATPSFAQLVDDGSGTIKAPVTSVLPRTVPNQKSTAPAMCILNSTRTDCTTALSTAATPAASAATTSVASSASPVTLLSLNSRRSGASITNDSTAILYVLLGAGTVSSTNYSYAIDAKTTVPGVLDVPADWTGIVTGVWVTANGVARITERSK
jgi:hypothetical protein